VSKEEAETSCTKPEPPHKALPQGCYVLFTWHSPATSAGRVHPEGVLGLPTAEVASWLCHGQHIQSCRQCWRQAAPGTGSGTREHLVFSSLPLWPQ